MQCFLSRRNLDEDVLKSRDLPVGIQAFKNTAHSEGVSANRKTTTAKCIMIAGFIFAILVAR